MTRLLCTLALALPLTFAACGDDARPGTGGADAGPMSAADSGPTTGRDSGPTTGRDSGPSTTDTCSTDDNPISTLGCNGPPPGAGVADNEFGGSCMTGGDSNPAGSCTGPMAVCAPDADGSATGICMATCTPSAPTYVSTGGCPMGGRCFDLGGQGVCFPDCNSAADCLSMNCDDEGSCVGGAPTTDAGVPPTDGGPAPVDAGT